MIYPWTKNKKERKKMRKYQDHNLKNKGEGENWYRNKLKEEGYKFNSQSVWGKRIFDLWNPKLGVVVEVDGYAHNSYIDSLKDKAVFLKSGIVVYRVRPYSEHDLAALLRSLKLEPQWNKRRLAMGLRGGSDKWIISEDMDGAIKAVKDAGLYCPYDRDLMATWKKDQPDENRYRDK